MNKIEMHPADRDALWLIGFRIDAESSIPDAYCLMVHKEDKDRPVSFEDQIVFFGRASAATKALQLASRDVQDLGPAPTEPDFVCDIASVLHLISAKNSDHSSIILNTLNIVFDLVDATGMSFDADQKRILWALADHLTFEEDFGDFIESPAIQRPRVINALLWAFGAIVSRVRFLR